MTLQMGDTPLPHDHGAPLRLIAPYSLGYKNIKYIYRIEFARQPRPGWWTLANPIYPMQAPVPVDRLRKKNRITIEHDYSLTHVYRNPATEDFYLNQIAFVMSIVISIFMNIYCQNEKYW
jgi:hypothetical protein